MDATARSGTDSDPVGAQPRSIVRQQIPERVATVAQFGSASATAAVDCAIGHCVDRIGCGSWPPRASRVPDRTRRSANEHKGRDQCHPRQPPARPHTAWPALVVFAHRDLGGATAREDCGDRA